MFSARQICLAILLSLPWSAGVSGATFWDDDPGCTPAAIASQTGGASAAGGDLQRSFDLFTNFGEYMPRIDCMRTAEGEADWPWIILLITVTMGVICWYARIYHFWRQSYFAEDERDRNPRMMELANIFFWCAVCGYAMSIVMFVWPAYRLLAVFLIVLNVWSWKFVLGIDDFKIALQARRLERELRESLRDRNEELARQVAERTKEAEEARRAAEDANESKSQFLANMSHEIRTPMTAILGYAELLSDQSSSVEQRISSVETIRRNGQHLLEVINDILDLSKIEAGQMGVERIETDVVSVVDDVIGVMRHHAELKGVEIDAEFEGEVPEIVRTDPTRLRQILINLAGNAVKFTQHGSVTLRIRCDVRDDRGVLEFRVIDSGIGMTSEQMSRLFKPFAQADESTTRRFGGTGLGLVLSRDLARLLGGDITVESVVGEGSTFCVTIDAGDVSGVAARSAEAIRGLRMERSRSPKHDGSLDGRVLLAEDSVDNQRLITFHLERMGLEVAVAENGRRAVDEARRSLDADEPFDLVLMDLQMPVLDGLSAVKELRGMGWDGPIVALTANAMSTERDRCLESGCDDFETKPIDIRSLRAVCARCLSGTGLRRSA